MVWIFILASIRGALGYSSSILEALGCSSSILEALGCSSSILEVVIVVLKSPGLATALGYLSSSRTGDLGVTESLHSSRSLVCLIMGRRPRSDDLVSASGCTSATLECVAMLTLSAWGSGQESCVVPDLDPSSWILILSWIWSMDLFSSKDSRERNSSHGG